VTYEEAVASAPPGWSMFELADIDILPAAYRARALTSIPAGELVGARSGDEEAGERVRRGLFWTLLYQLRPDLWDALASAEPIHPQAVRLIHELGADRGRVLEIGAGSGRFTRHLASAHQLLAVDPSLPLLHLLRKRLPRAWPVAGWAEALPVVDRWADATVSCASVDLDTGVLVEAERVTRPGGLIVVINPPHGARPGWMAERFDPDDVGLPERDPAIDRIFGKPVPPSEVVWRRVLSPGSRAGAD
jgi:SAM-dependent methyltransferase